MIDLSRRKLGGLSAAVAMLLAARPAWAHVGPDSFAPLVRRVLRRGAPV